MKMIVLGGIMIAFGVWFCVKGLERSRDFLIPGVGLVIVGGFVLVKGKKIYLGGESKSDKGNDSSDGSE